MQSKEPDALISQIVKLAIFAVGGQGGGVLNGWIVDLAERNGYDVQTTSVAGVAQRTGATTYYLEMLPTASRRPVFSLAPSEGDLDILIAAELMEAGRAIMRGFVVQDHTKVIASTHRQFATIEKVVPGDGISDADKVIATVREQAGHVLAFDMQRIAEEEGTVISAALFGAMAGAEVLPFDAESYRETISTSGRGVENSLAAFERALKIANAGEEKKTSNVRPSGSADGRQAQGPAALIAEWRQAETRLLALPDPVRMMANAGLRKVVGFQDLTYGGDYLDRLEILLQHDADAGGKDKAFAFTTSAAKHLANAMAYDDIIRVADAKTRAGRFQRIDAEVGASERHLTRVTEYTHPGAAEVVSLLPSAIGARIDASPRLMRIIDRLVNRGRHIRTDHISGFLQLYMLAGLRRWRRSLLRHRCEMAHIENWIGTAQDRLPRDYDLAIETLNARRLIKGYSDTHARGLSKFSRVMEGTALVDGRIDAADWARRLIWAALKDAKGENLDGALKTIQSFVGDQAVA